MASGEAVVRLLDHGELELIDQMGATFTFDENEPDGLVITLQLPIHSGEA